MRVREALREGRRDVVSGAAAAGVLALVIGAALAGIVGLRTAALAADVRDVHAWVAAGSATLVVTAEGRVDGAACDALADRTSVLAAGALRSEADGVTPLALPRTAVPGYAVTAGLPEVLAIRDGALRSAGVLLSAEVADELGVEAGEPLVTSAGATRVGAVYGYPDDGRDPDLAYAVLTPALTDGQAFDACWATIWPQDDEVSAAARRVVLPSTGAEGESRVTVGQLNPRLGERFEPSATASHGRVTALTCVAAGLLIGAAAVHRRRLSIASDRHVGVPVAAQVISTGLAALAGASVGAAAAFAGSVVLLRGFGVADAAPIALEAAIDCGLGVSGALLGTVVGVAMVRERRLHRYFRTR